MSAPSADVRQRFLVFCVTYSHEQGEDLDDVQERLAGTLARSPGVASVDALHDRSLEQLRAELQEHLTTAGRTADQEAALRDLHRAIVLLLDEAFKRGVAVALLADQAMPDGLPETLGRRVAECLARTAHVAYLHQTVVRQLPWLWLLATEVTGVFDVVIGLDLTSPDERARSHLARIDQLLDRSEHSSSQHDGEPTTTTEATEIEPEENLP